MLTRLDIIYDPTLPHVCTLDLYLPDGIAAPPLYVYLHGGGLEAGDKRDAKHLAEPLTNAGVALASVNYRMYPAYRFPDYLNDAAQAVHWLRNDPASPTFGGLVFGGSSAGAYIAMMLYANGAYLRNHGVSPNEIAGYHFDAGQPTVHYNVLKYERGLDSRAMRIDEAAPLFFLDHPLTPEEVAPLILMESAEHDLTNRPEQLHVMETAMIQFGFPPERLRRKVNMGFGHCGYHQTTAFAQDIISLVKDAAVHG